MNILPEAAYAQHREQIIDRMRNPTSEYANPAAESVAYWERGRLQREAFMALDAAEARAALRDALVPYGLQPDIGR